jgi:hypothetical protein
LGRRTSYIRLSVSLRYLLALDATPWDIWEAWVSYWCTEACYEAWLSGYWWAFSGGSMSECTTIGLLGA